MAQARNPAFVRFFVGVLAAQADLLPAVESALEEVFGAIDLRSGPLPFRYTTYYEGEAGPRIVRVFYGFGDIHPGTLAERKVRTNALELRLAHDLATPWPRPVNLDPGFLAPDKLVLASAKNFSHRIYLDHGIYAEVTLQYRHGGFIALPWTFPDYASGDYDPFFLELRDRHMQARVRPETT